MGGHATAPGLWGPSCTVSIGVVRGVIWVEHLSLNEDLREKIRDFLASLPEIEAVYVFGSVAKGTDTKKSDLDLGLLFAEPAPDCEQRFEWMLTLAATLEKIIGRPVDLVDLAVAPLILQSQVLKYGFLLYERHHRAHVEYEVNFRRKFFDFKPFWETYRRKMVADLTGKRS